MKLYTQTDIGLVRSSNQDIVDGGTLYDGAVVWTVLCDGMGGANGGNVASNIARNAVKENIGLFDIHGSDYHSEDFLNGIVDKANSSVYHEQLKKPELKGMGTTFELIVASQGKAMIVHVGDSRIYLVHNGEIQQAEAFLWHCGDGSAAADGGRGGTLGRRCGGDGKPHGQRADR